MKDLLSSLIIVISFLNTIHLFAQSQSIITGIVLDSATLQPLPFVAIQIKGKPSGRSSSVDGSFSISCFMKDTLVFTRLGYNPALYVVKLESEPLKIELAENSRMLKDITIYDRIIIPGIDEWKKDVKPAKPLKFENTNGTNPNYGMMPTFGPGITFGFGGKDKTKKKRDDLVRTEVFRSTINSPEVKKQLTDLYTISEETYYRKLELFNKENPDAAFLTSRDEILSMLIQFFALKEP
jgi:CarboxypepD_reg-like domain